MTSFARVTNIGRDFIIKSIGSKIISEEQNG